MPRCNKLSAVNLYFSASGRRGRGARRLRQRHQRLTQRLAVRHGCWKIEPAHGVAETKLAALGVEGDDAPFPGRGAEELRRVERERVQMTLDRKSTRLNSSHTD